MTQRRILFLLAAIIACLGGGLSLPASAQRAVTTQNGDNARTGANITETALTPGAVSSGNFGKLFTIKGLDANVNGQPLYVPQVAVGGMMRNVLVAYQSNNTDHSPCAISAWDADTGAVLWHMALPLSATYTTATPAIDANAGIIYVLTKTDNDDTGATYLHAIGLATGKELPGSPVHVQATARGTGDGNVNGVVSFDGAAKSGRFHANDRAGLLLLNGIVYASFAHNSDSFPYHGWVLGYHYDGAAFTQTAVFCTTPNGGDGGIWQAGKGLTADADGNIYCSVGNGTFDANTKGITAGTDYGMCYLKLSPALQVLDWFAPFDQQAQSNQDLDMGNTGLVGIPGTTRLFAGATKFGSGFLLDSHALGGYTPNGPDKALLRLNGLSDNDNVGQNPVSWDAGNAKYVYLWPGNSNLKQFAYSTATNTFSPAGVFKQTANQTAGGSLAVTSNGGKNGIVWAVGYDGVLHAFDAADVSKPELWNSTLNASRDSLGSVGHFQFPTVTNGKVYVPTGSASIAVYGLLHSVWTAVSVASGPDGQTRVLWSRSDGAMTLWTLAPDGSLAVRTDIFIPDPGWTAKAVSVGPDNNAHILWNNADGRMTPWTITSQGRFVGFFPTFGPYPGWTAQAIATGPDGNTHILWDNADGRMTLWTLDANGQQLGQFPTFGPYPGWQTTAISIGPNNNSHILWDNADGRMMPWTLNPSNQQVGTFPTFVPYAGWTAVGISSGPDNNTHILWDNVDGRMTPWTLDANNQFVGYFPTFVPYAGWTAVGISSTPNGNTHILWNNSDGRMTPWTLDSNSQFVGFFPTYGPY